MKQKSPFNSKESHEDFGDLLRGFGLDKEKPGDALTRKLQALSKQLAKKGI